MDALSLFQPVVRRWFEESYAGPTPAQTLGWPRIAAGEHTLILAPTGSGKTLAAFLYAINERIARGGLQETGVHTLYLSPLRALAADIERNLEAPLEGIRRCGEEMGIDVPAMNVAVRTGDTTASQRQRMVRRPPDLLITTPESLHLLLTSVRAREMLRTVRYVIVDEVHALSTSKRGSFLALLLERLEELTPRAPVRIGLSATQRPLDRVARFLGGYANDGTPRPVSIVDAGMRKDLDLSVVSPVKDMKSLPAVGAGAPTIWPAIYERLVDWVGAHTSTLVFANNRRAVERIAAEMNRIIGYAAVRAHHGSVSKESRREIETNLKEGRLPALVATSSLELGIDIGAIDLVCQVETPHSVASALQRIGRAGHVYRATSVGRMLPKTREDLWRMAAMARAMKQGEISAVTIPANPLDVLAQQVIAMVAMDDWTTDALYETVRRAAPFHGLPRDRFDAVLEMVSGRYRSPLFPGLRPRVAWEKATQTLHALPGARHTAVLNGGTIPDSAEYPMVLEDGKTRLGELDEEFVFERRVGDAIVLGTGRWRILDIRHDCVVVAPSEHDEALMPFWKAEGLGHDAEFGERLGAFTRACEERLGTEDLEAWLQQDCALDAAAAENLARYLRDQSECGPLPNDRTVLVDAFPNEAGDPRVAIVSPFGRGFHLALWLALRQALRERGEPIPEAVFSNAGILLRTGALRVERIVETLISLAGTDVAGRIAREVESTPYFALRFRRNASRALLLPRSHPGKRIPLWLQRLRSHDLLQYASEHPRFPIVTETYREILEDELPIDRLARFLDQVGTGEARFAVRRGTAPTPFSASLVMDFVGKYLYEADEPAPRRGRTEQRDPALDLLDPRGEGEALISPDAVRTMEERLQGRSPFHRARDGAEAVDLLRRIGDLSENELVERCEPAAAEAIPALKRDRRIVLASRAGSGGPRWIAAEDDDLYASSDEADLRRIVERHVAAHAGRTRADLLACYPGADGEIAALTESGRIVRAQLPGLGDAFVDRDVLLGLRRLTLALRRRRTSPASPDRLAAAVIRAQHVAQPATGEDGLRGVLSQLGGRLLPAGAWQAVLRARVHPFRAADVDALIRSGAVEWRAWSDGAGRWIGFSRPESASLLLPTPYESEEAGLPARVRSFLLDHGASFLQRIAEGLEESSSEIDAALWDLMWRGAVTNDSLSAALRPRPRASARPPRGGLGVERVGRWSSVGAASGTEKREIDIAPVLRLMLDRNRVVCREIVRREAMSRVPWGDAYGMLSRMEWRGEADRGFYVHGLSGPQFAAPGVEAELARQEIEETDETPILLHVSDPANLYGDVLPIVTPSGERYIVRHHSGNYLVLFGGTPALAVEANGRRLVPLTALDGARRRRAVGTLRDLVRHAGQPTSIRVETWDGIPAGDSVVAEDLASAGFIREDRSMMLYRDYGEAR